MADRPSLTERRAAIVAPLLIVATMPVVFGLLGSTIGSRSGWLAGFVVYWGVWGFGFPIWLLGRGRAVGLLRTWAIRPRPVDVLLLLGPPVGSAVMGAVPFSDLSPLVLIIAAAFAIANGTAEELLWRGVFVAVFPTQRWWGLFYPAIAFGAWHLAPQVVDPAAEGAMQFAVAAIVLGLVYGIVAHRTKSVRWTALSHVVADFASFSTFVELLRNG